MPNLGAPELLILLVIVLMLFGVGRLGKLGGDLGSGIRAFRDGIKSPDESVKTPIEPDIQPEEILQTSQENLEQK